MRVAIVTLPLHTNYGGLLQAYALKSVLTSLGHEADVLDLKEKMPVPKGFRAPFVYISRIFRKMIGTRHQDVFREVRYHRELPARTVYISAFTDRFIAPRVLDSYRDIKEGEYDAFVVGSDQVWRPLYFSQIEDAFLGFTEGWNVRRLSYAASFGTDQLEYEYVTLQRCAELLSHFDAVSVREDTAVGMCEEWLDCDSARHVLDPTMLVDQGTYRKFAESAAEHPSQGKIMTYILDPSPEKEHVLKFVEKVSGYGSYALNMEGPVPSVEQWLAGFADSEFVVTDSFHGCVLSILMHKRFIAVGNSRRGMARMSSLLSMFGLDQRLVHGIDPDDDGEFFLSEPDWSTVDDILCGYRSSSIEFLEEALKDR